MLTKAHSLVSCMSRRAWMSLAIDGVWFHRARSTTRRTTERSQFGSGDAAEVEELGVGAGGVPSAAPTELTNRHDQQDDERDNGP
jgi:hypothetical protein